MDTGDKTTEEAQMARSDYCLLHYSLMAFNYLQRAIRSQQGLYWNGPIMTGHFRAYDAGANVKDKKDFNQSKDYVQRNETNIGHQAIGPRQEHKAVPLNSAANLVSKDNAMQAY